MFLKLLLLAATLCLAACGHQLHQLHQPVGPPPGINMAGPVLLPCLFPTADELADLASFTSVVAIGQADGAQVVHRPGISTPYTRHTFHIQSIVLGAASGKTLVIEETGGVPIPILEPGQYLLFLSRNGSTYYITNGLYGAFPVRGNDVVRQCPTFPATAAKQEAPGGGARLQDFVATIHNLPTVTPPHK